jgi:hypothetical protein
MLIENLWLQNQQSAISTVNRQSSKSAINNQQSTISELSYPVSPQQKIQRDDRDERPVDGEHVRR